MGRRSVSFDPWSHSPDLARLIEAGYELEITSDGYLIVHNVPFLDGNRSVQRGLVITRLALNGDVTENPVSDHVAFFSGLKPYQWNGEPVHPLADTNVNLADGRSGQFQISLKCATAEHYPDYFAKIEAHVQNIEVEAQKVDSTATAKTGGPCIIDNDEWPFEYADTASGRAGLGAINALVSGQRIAIIGVGGTGSYILDLVAKCPVAEIHLYDGDRFSSHNAFAPQVQQASMKFESVDIRSSAMQRFIRG